MSAYDVNNFNSELDAYKWLDDSATTTITVSGNLQAASVVGEQYYDSATLTLPYDVSDFRVWVFDNSYYHSGTYVKDGVSYIRETTIGSDLTAPLQAIVSANTIKFRLRLLNPYGLTVALTTTTLNIRLLVYDATIV